MHVLAQTHRHKFLFMSRKPTLVCISLNSLWLFCTKPDPCQHSHARLFTQDAGFGYRQWSSVSHNNYSDFHTWSSAGLLCATPTLWPPSRDTCCILMLNLCQMYSSKRDVKVCKMNKRKERENVSGTDGPIVKCCRCYIIQLLGISHISNKKPWLILFQEIHLPIACPGCDPIPVEYLRWRDPEPIAAVVFACLGLMATFFVTAVFIR